MKFLSLTKNIAALALAAVLLNSCDKPDEVDPIGDKGQSIVKIIGGGDPAVKLWSVDFVATPSTLLAVDVRRDLSNEAQLNTEMTVVVKDDQAAVTAVDPSLVQMPEAYYTYDAGGVIKTGGNYTLVFKPGEIAKTIYVTIPDATVMNTSSTYGLGFTITSVTGGNAVIGSAKSLVYKIGAKNAYDGTYKLSGTFFHPTQPGYSGPFGTAATGGDIEIDLITIGASTVKRDLGSPVDENFMFYNTGTGGLGYFSNVSYRLTINPATNLVTLTPGPTNGVTLDQYTGCTYDPATKKIHLNAGYNGSRLITEDYEYLRSR